MMRKVQLALACLAPALALAQQVDHSAHEGHGQSAVPTGVEAAPPVPPTDHAADAFYDPAAMAAARAQLEVEGGGMRAHALELPLAEIRFDAGGTSWRVEGGGWVGSDANRLRLRFDGESDTDDRLERARLEVQYWRAFTNWWNLVAGVRFDPRPEPSRGFLSLGIEGLAPYGVELRFTGYVSDDGEVEARLETHTDFRLTQHLVLEPRLTMDLSLDDVPERQLGKGIPNLELGLRLRWEQKRRFVPYLGLEWQGRFGDTARYASAAGEDPRVLRLVAGASAWL